MHASFFVATHVLELRNDVAEPQSFADALGGAGFEHDVHNVDVEVVVCRLIWSGTGGSASVKSFKKREGNGVEKAGSEGETYNAGSTLTRPFPRAGL